MSIGSTIFSTDWLPSILIKESRQFVRSRLVTSVLCIELLALVGVTGIILGFLEISAGGEDTLTTGVGRGQLIGVVTVLLVALGLAAYDGLLRTAREHDDRRNEMLSITGLTPWRLVIGKVFSGWLLGCLVLTAGIPFLVLAYLMRGVSLVVLGATCLLLFEYILLAVVLAQVVAKLSLPGFIRRLGGVGLLGLLAFFPFGTMTYAIIENGSGNSREIVMILKILGLITGLTILVLLVMARFFFAQPLSIRTRVARLSLLGLQGLAGAGIWGWWLFTGTVHGMGRMERDIITMVLTVLSSFEIGLALLVMALECRNFWRRQDNRWVLLDEGVGGGVLLALLLGAGIPIVVLFVRMADNQGGHELNGLLALWNVVALFLISTVLGWIIANVVSRKFQRRLSPLLMAVVSGVFLGFACAIVAGSLGMLGGFEVAVVTLAVISASVLAVLLVLGTFQSPMPEAESLSPETAIPEPVLVNNEPERPVATLKRHLFAEDWLIRPLSRWEWVNPVFLKEFRQLWRSRAISWMLWMLGGLMLLTMAWISTGEGDVFLMLLLLLQGGISLLPAVLAIIQLNRSIREIEDQEMLFITALTPRQIRRGKTLSALAICLAVGLPLLWFLFLLTLFFAGFSGLKGFGALLLMPVACVALVTIAVAVAWSPLPNFHKRYLAPLGLVLLASPMIIKGLWNLGLEIIPSDWNLHEAWSADKVLTTTSWLVIWVTAWLIARVAADGWLHRRAAWRRL
jgi:hypothetical protein